MEDITTELNKIQDVWKSIELKKYIQKEWNREEFEQIVNSDEYKERFPEKKLDRKFRELLYPFHYYFFGKKTIYCKLSRKDEEESENGFVFSAISPRMISVDNAFFENGFYPEEKTSYSILDLLYKPYIYELFFDYLPQNIIETLRADVWYKVEIAKNCWNLLTDEEIEERFGKEARERYRDGQRLRSSGLERDRYYFDDKETEFFENEILRNYQDYNIVLGRLTYGASPLDSREVKIKWNNEIASWLPVPSSSIFQGKVDNYCSKQPQSAINDQIKKLFDKDLYREVIVKRFGQANTIIVNNIKNNGDEISFAFDLGLPIDGNLKWNKNILDTNASQIYDSVDLSFFNPQVIFISHWDLDHYKASYTLNRDVYIGDKASVWIVPKYMVNPKSIPSDPLSTERLICFLMNTRKILFVDDPTPLKFKEIYTDSSISLYRVNKSKKPNNDCIILQLNQTLMTGDCDYKNWVYDCKRPDSVRCLVAPHHGALCLITSKEEGKLKTDYGNMNVVYFCVGLNGYGHPYGIKPMYEDTTRLNIPHVYCTNDTKRNYTDFIFVDK